MRIQCGRKCQPLWATVQKWPILFAFSIHTSNTWLHLFQLQNLIGKEAVSEVKSQRGETDSIRIGRLMGWGRQEFVLLLQSTWVWFPASRQRISQPPRTLAPWDLTGSSGLHGYLYSDAHAHSLILYPFSEGRSRDLSADRSNIHWVLLLLGTQRGGMNTYKYGQGSEFWCLLDWPYDFLHPSLSHQQFVGAGAAVCLNLSSSHDLL